MRTPRQPSKAATRIAKNQAPSAPLGAEAGYHFGATGTFPEETPADWQPPALLAVQEGILQRRVRFLRVILQLLPAKLPLYCSMRARAGSTASTIAPRRRAFLYELFEGSTGYLRKLIDDVAHLVHPAALYQTVG